MKPASIPKSLQQAILQFYEFILCVLALAIDDGFKAHLISLVENGGKRRFIVRWIVK